MLTIEQINRLESLAADTARSLESPAYDAAAALKEAREGGFLDWSAELTEADYDQLKRWLVARAEIARLSTNDRELAYKVLGHLADVQRCFAAGDLREACLYIRLMQLAGEYLFAIAQQRLKQPPSPSTVSRVGGADPGGGAPNEPA